MNMHNIKEHIGECIALIVTAVLGVVFIDFALLMTYMAIMNQTVDREISIHFGALLVAFVAVWKTNFSGNTSVTADTANVSAGTGSPSPANVEKMTVTNTTTTPEKETEGEFVDVTSDTVEEKPVVEVKK